MGIDGFSMSNLGLNRNLTSAQLANDAEATARQSLDNQIADSDGVGKREKVGKKDEDAAFNGMIPFIPPDEENKDDNPQDEKSEQKNPVPQMVSSDDEDEEETPKYLFRYNSNEMIEIWDSETNKILKTISPEQAQKVIGKIDKVPGVLVNKEI